MRLAAVLALACLVGCASTPAELRSTSPGTQHTLTLAPAQAAGCIARNIENNNRFQTAALRPTAQADHYEIAVRAPEAPIYGTLYLIEVKPAARGSHATIWGTDPGDGFSVAAVKGC